MPMKSDRLKSLYMCYKKEFPDRKLVFGDGNPYSSVLLIGEAPGKEEIRLSKPFVGAAGKNLENFLYILDVKRSSLYITNVIKYRLSKLNTKTGRIINRPATKTDIKQNRNYILEEIRIIKPKIIVTLGNVAVRAVTGKFNINIGTIHGKMHKISSDVVYNCSLFPLYHPASIIYNRKLKGIYINDLGILKNRIKETIK